MNILVVSAQKPDSTGSGVYLAETVRAFCARGHKVAVIAGIDIDDEPILPKSTLFFPVRFCTDTLPFPVCGMSDEMPYKATRYRDMTSAMVSQFCAAFREALAEVREQFEPDVVICHHLYLATAVVVEAAFTCPVAAVCHSTDLRQMHIHDLERARIVQAMRKLDCVFALHEAQKCEIAELYGIPFSRICVVGTGYNDAVFYEGDSQYRRTDGALDVAYAGKIWRKKGVASLIRCLDMLPYPPKQFCLRLAGGYNSATELAYMQELATKSRYDVEFLGKLSQESLARVYRQSHVFVLPSFFEGLPLVVIEALACGCVVVVSDLAGIRDWLNSAAPAAPVVYVAPPRMVGVDEPLQKDLPAFEQRLASALVRAADMAENKLNIHKSEVREKGAQQVCSSTPLDTTFAGVRHLSWDALAKRMLEALIR